MTSTEQKISNQWDILYESDDDDCVACDNNLCLTLRAHTCDTALRFAQADRKKQLAQCVIIERKN